MEDEFEVHGTYSVSNSIGFEIQISLDGSMLRGRRTVNDIVEISDWEEILPDFDAEGEGDLPMVADVFGWTVQLEQVMRAK